MPVLVKALGGPVQLLPLALVGLVGCFVVVLAIGARFAATLGGGTTQASGEPGAPEQRAGLSGLLQSRYFLLMAGLVILLNVANYVVDFAFLSQVRGRFEGSTESRSSSACSSASRRRSSCSPRCSSRAGC